MTEFGQTSFIIIIATIIGLIIQYYLIKAAITHALFKYDKEKNKESENHNTKLLELIALEVGRKKETENYFKVLRKNELMKKYYEIKYDGGLLVDVKNAKIRELKKEYADVLDEIEENKI